MTGGQDLTASKEAEVTLVAQGEDGGPTPMSPMTRGCEGSGWLTSDSKERRAGPQKLLMDRSFGC